MRASTSRSSSSTASAGSWRPAKRRDGAVGEPSPAGGSTRSWRPPHLTCSSSSSSRPPELPAYQELRAGFTAAVSHELRTPLARLLVLLESATLPGSDVDRADGAGAAGGRAGARADRRRAVPRRARDRPRGRLPSAARRRSRSWRRSSPRSPSARTTPRSRSRFEPTAASSCRCGRGCCASWSRTCLRTRSAMPGREARCTRRAGESGRRPGAHGLGRRQGRRRRRPAAPVRALLPRRPGAHEPRHGPRPRDREARRHLGRRRGRGNERARPGPRDPRPLPARR